MAWLAVRLGSVSGRSASPIAPGGAPPSPEKRRLQWRGESDTGAKSPDAAATEVAVAGYRSGRKQVLDMLRLAARLADPVFLQHPFDHDARVNDDRAHSSAVRSARASLIRSVESAVKRRPTTCGMTGSARNGRCLLAPAGATEVGVSATIQRAQCPRPVGSLDRQSPRPRSVAGLKQRQSSRHSLCL